MTGLITQRRGRVGQGGAAVPIAYTDHGDDSDATIAASTWDTVSFTTTRAHVVVLAGAYLDATGDIASVVIDPAGDNVSMTELIQVATGATRRRTSIWIAEKTLSSQIIRYTTSTGNFNDAWATVLSLDNVQSTTPEATDEVYSGGVNSVSLTVAGVTSGGVLLAMGLVDGSTAGVTWTNAVEVSDGSTAGSINWSGAVQLGHDGSAVTMDGEDDTDHALCVATIR